MSELLEVDYGNEDIQNDIKNQQFKIEVDKDPTQEKKEDFQEEKDLSLKKNLEKNNKDPIFFVLRLSEEILSSSLCSSQFIVSEDVYVSNQKYFESFINVYVILLANESNIIKAFTKKSQKNRIFDGNAVKIPFDLRYEVNLPVNEILKETSKLTEKDIHFSEILTKIRTSVGEKLRDIISRRSKKKNKANPPVIESKTFKEVSVKKEEKNNKEIKQESVNNDKKESGEKKEKNDIKLDKKERRSSSKHKTNDKTSKNKNRKKSSHSRNSSSSSSKKKSYPMYHPTKYPLLNKKPMMNSLMKVPQQQYYPSYEYSLPNEQNLSYYYQQSYYPHNPINPMFQPKYPMNPAYIPWMNPELKDNMMNAPHGEYMKNYFFDAKVGFDNIRDYEDMNVHPPINISNINFIKNNQKKEDYSRKKRRRKSYSESSSSSSDSSSVSKKKKSSYTSRDKKYEKKFDSKTKYDKGNRSSERKEEKNNYKDRSSKFKLASDVKEPINEIKNHSKTKEVKDKRFSEEKENSKNIKTTTSVYNNNKVISKFQEKSDSGENTDDLMKNSPILNKFSEENNKQIKKERKTKFSDENPSLKKSVENEQKTITMIFHQNLNNNETSSQIENPIKSIVPIEHCAMDAKEDEVRNNISNEKRHISLLKKSAPLNVQKKIKGDTNTENQKSNEEEKEEGEIEERSNKNFKIVNSSGKKKILLTNKRKVNDIKVVKKENI